MSLLSPRLATATGSRQISSSNFNFAQFTRLRLHWLLLCVFLVSTLHAQTPPPVYVSTGSSQQILQIDGVSGAITGICGVPFVAEDVVVGPDNYLYIADTADNKILRVDISSTLPAPASPAASCNAVTVYDAGGVSTLCTSGGNPATCPTGPEGPSFLRMGTIDLYFTTHGTNPGVWRVEGVASSGPNVSPNCPLNCPVTQVASFGSGAGEGSEFDIFGNLLAVDQAGNRVMRSIANSTDPTKPPFSAAQAFITTSLSSPFGVALNTCGDVLVATGKYVNRYDSTTGAFIDRLSLGGNNYPKFLEVDAANRIFLTTATDETGKNATVWRFDPANAGTSSAVTSCALPKYTNVWTQALSTKTTLGLVNNNALGLGLGPSTFAITQTLSSPSYSATFNFGAQHSFSVTCTSPTSPGTPIPMTVTAYRSRPTDSTAPEFTFSNPFPTVTTPSQCPYTITNPVCVHYGSLHGFCTQYLETGSPDPNTLCNNFQFKIGFFTAETFATPGGAHSIGALTSDPFTECQSEDFYSTAGPGLDTGARLDGSNSKHVMFNSDLKYPGSNIVLNSPISSCSPTGTCNPQFNSGQNISVKFTLTTSGGAAITDATEQLSVILLQTTLKGVTTTLMEPQTVVATKNSATANFFVPNSSGQYSYNLDSSKFRQLPKGTVATYQFNIWGNGHAPYMFPVNVQY